MISLWWLFLRCMISKHVAPDEIGKILSIVGAIQSFIPIISSPVFGLIYKNTVKIYPQMFLLILAGLFFVDWCVLVVIHFGLKKIPAYSEEDREVEMKDMNANEKALDEIEENAKMIITNAIPDDPKQTNNAMLKPL